jgi:hypothetical protein
VIFLFVTSKFTLIFNFPTFVLHIK